MMKLTTASSLLSLLLAGCGPRPEPAPDPAPRAAAPVEAATDSAAVAADVNRLADLYVERYFEHHPADATVSGYGAADHGRLNDITPAGRAAWQRVEDALLAEVRSLDPEPLRGSSDFVTYGFLIELLEGAEARRVCRTELWEVSPTWTGWPSELGFTASVQPVGSPEEREAALRRWSELPGYIDAEIANLREGLRSGYTAPKVNVRAVVEQAENLVTGDPTASPFYNPATRADDPAFKAAFEQLIRDEINPAIRRYRDFLNQEYLPGARDDIAVSANPEGAACYEASVRFWTSIGYPAEEIHQIGLDQMALIQTEMKEIARRSFDTDDIPGLLQRLRTEPEYTFRSREHMLEYARAAVERARQAVPRWFGLVPEATVVVEPYPAFRERSAPGGEYSPAPDDLSRPAVYLINAYQADKTSIAGIESTAFHEAYPGHHLQISIAKEFTTGHPITRYFGFSGFSEGWALYAERLSDEMGLFSGDIDRLGLFSNEALRAARLVVDAGMHRMGWSRQQAVDYILAHTAESQRSAEAEINRYIAVPGQATSYMLGNLEILRLREMAERELGDAFDIREFHDAVLEQGGLTLPLLRANVERWVETYDDR